MNTSAVLSTHLPLLSMSYMASYLAIHIPSQAKGFHIYVLCGILSCPMPGAAALHHYCHEAHPSWLCPYTVLLTGLLWTHNTFLQLNS